MATALRAGPASIPAYKVSPPKRGIRFHRGQMNAGGIPAFHCPARSRLCGRIPRVHRGLEKWGSSWCKKTGHQRGERAKGKEEELTGEGGEGHGFTGVRASDEEHGCVVTNVSGARFWRQRRQGVRMLPRLAHDGHLGGRLLCQPSKLPPPPGCRGRSPVESSWGPGSPLPLGGESWSELFRAGQLLLPSKRSQGGPCCQASARLSAQHFPLWLCSAQLPGPPPAQASANHFCRRRGGLGSGLLLSLRLPDRALPLLLAALQTELFPPSLRLPRSGPAQLALGSLPFQWFPSVVSCSRGLGLPPCSSSLLLDYLAFVTPSVSLSPFLSPSPYKWLCRSAGSAGSTSNVSMVPC